MHSAIATGAPPRLLSLDVFRGLIIAAMILVTDPGTYSARYAPFCHSDWTGPTATDIISPAFLLMIGMAIPLSFASRLRRETFTGTLLLHILRRTIILIVLGLFLNAFPEFRLRTLRIPGILQHIALCYCATSLLFLAATRLTARSVRPSVQRSQILAGAAIALLALYGGLLKYVPVPGFGPGRFDSLGNLAAFVDRSVFGVPHLWSYGTTPGYGVTFDPDGLLSSLSGIAIMLIGTLVSEWLRTRHTPQRKLAVLTFAGASLITVGYGLHPWIPLIKKIWTPSFALLSSGWALLLFSLLYLLVDLLQRRAWTFPFRVFGTNAIFAFALSTVITTLAAGRYIRVPDAPNISFQSWTYHRLFLPWLSPRLASLAYAVAIVLLNLALVSPLFRKRIFLRL